MATPREVELADALAAVRERLSDAAAAAGSQTPTKSNCSRLRNSFRHPMYSILSHLGCAAFGESREQEAVAKVGRSAIRAEPAATDSLAHGRPHSAQQGAVDRRLGVRRALGGQRELIAALDRAAARGAGRGRAAGAAAGLPPAQPRRRPRSRRRRHRAPRPRRRAVRAGRRSADGLEFVGLMAHPAAGSDPDDAFARLAGRTASGYRAPTSSASGCRQGCPATSRRR